MCKLTVQAGPFSLPYVTAVAQKLDRCLKIWKPRTARKVQKLVSEIIALADQERELPVGRYSKPRRDRFYSDREVWRKKGPSDTAANHDKYLYGNDE